jgi:ribosomal protein L44E
MALPILNTPTFEVELPLSKKTITYRPFLVKEEKVLLMALESQDQKQIMRAMHDIIGACTFGKVDGKDLPVAELEYLFLKLRSKAVGEKSHIGLKCTDCQTSNELDIDLESIQIDVSTLPDLKIMLTDQIGIMMKYPSSDLVMKSVDPKKTDTENTYAIIMTCIDKIFDTENVYDVATQSKQELVDFIESLNKAQFEKIKDFFSGLPKLKKDISFKCTNCGKDNHVYLEGLESFFG